MRRRSPDAWPFPASSAEPKSTRSWSCRWALFRSSVAVQFTPRSRSPSPEAFPNADSTANRSTVRSPPASRTRAESVAGSRRVNARSSTVRDEVRDVGLDVPDVSAGFLPRLDPHPGRAAIEAHAVADPQRVGEQAGRGGEVDLSGDPGRRAGSDRELSFGLERGQRRPQVELVDRPLSLRLGDLPVARDAIEARAVAGQEGPRGVEVEQCRMAREGPLARSSREAEFAVEPAGGDHSLRGERARPSPSRRPGSPGSPARACHRWRAPRTSSWSGSPAPRPGPTGHARRPAAARGESRASRRTDRPSGARGVRGRGTEGSPRDPDLQVGPGVPGEDRPAARRRGPRCRRPAARHRRLARSSTSVPRRGRSKVCQRLRSQVARGAARTRSPWRSRRTTPVIRVGRNQESRIEATSSPPGARIRLTRPSKRRRAGAVPNA